jgi:MFS transporter, NNP family, nitrate/nitrite transporter
MTEIRQSRDRAHPTQTNTILLGIIAVLIGIVSMQVWLLTASLNTALDGDDVVVWPAFYASVALFLSGVALLRYLPQPLHLAARPVVRESFERAGLAWRTLAISTVSLALAFAVWFTWSALPVKLNAAGFNLSRGQLFWLTASPVVLGALLRIPYSMLVSRYGSRRSYAAVTLVLVLPCLATAIAVSNPATSFGVLLMCAALTGVAGANFATSMAAVTLWFPRSLQGTALGVNGLGNLGVTVAQFTVPVVIGVGLFSAFRSGPADSSGLHLENAALVWVPLILICAAAIWFWTEDYPAPRRTLASQLVAGKRLHTWVLSYLYFLTFGGFVAMGASLPLIIHEVFGEAPGGAPSPLLYAPVGPLVGTLARPLGGWLADRFGAGRVTGVATGVMALGGFGLSAFLEPHQFTGFFLVILLICTASGLGNGSVFKIIPTVLSKDAGAAIGIVSCIGALGGFFPPLLLAWTLDRFGSPAWAYTLMALFGLSCFGLSAWFYGRRGSPTHC